MAFPTFVPYLYLSLTHIRYNFPKNEMVEDGNKGPWVKSVATQRLKYVSSISGNTRNFPPSYLFPIEHSLRNKYKEVQHFESDSLVYTN